MSKRENTFTLKAFGKDTKLLQYMDMGIVIEKQRLITCAYATDVLHEKIHAVMPLSTVGKMRGLEYKVCFRDDRIATIAVADLRIVIDYKNRKCANNKELNIYGNGDWGEVVDIRWQSDFDKYFK